jgi:uncharacterized membrane protein
METLYAITQASLGRILPEAFVYYLTFICLVVAIVIEALVVYLLLRRFWRRSFWVAWVKFLIARGCRKILRRKQGNG